MQNTPSIPKNLSSRPFSRQSAVAETKQLFLQGPQNGEDSLIQPPPTVHPEQLLPEVVADNGLSTAFFAPTQIELSRMKQRFENEGLSTRRISSKRDRCSSYNGQEGERTAKQIKSIVRDRTPLGFLHQTGKLPCQPGCEYNAHPQQDFNEQVLLAHPVRAYSDAVMEDRAMFTCSLRGDEYITTIKNPVEALGPYLQSNTDFDGYGDFIRNRGFDQVPSAMDYAIGPFQAVEPEEEFGLDITEPGHYLAPRIVFELLHTRELGNGWETSFHHREDSYGNLVPSNRPPVNAGDPFDIAGLDYFRHRVVRQPGDTPADDRIYVLDVPDFSAAQSVVAFDIDPTPWMWNLYYGTNFDHLRVFDDAETAAFLRREMGARVGQTANSRKNYDGRGVTPGRDASIALWTDAEFGKRPVVVSTKNALRIYRSEQPNLLRTDVQNGIQYRGGDDIINDHSPVIILNGCPRPRNFEFQLWGALAGKSVPPESNANQSFGKVGNEVRHQFSESRIAKWATRFESRDAVVILNTAAVPIWLQDPRLVTRADPTAVLPSNATARRKVARYLRRRGENGNSVTMSEIQSETGVSENAARKAKDRFIDEGWITEHDTEGHRPNEYSWNE